MMPRALQEQGLIAAVEEMLRLTLANANIDYQFEHFKADNRLEPRIEISLYRIIQELVKNIIVHSQAKNVHVQLIDRKLLGLKSVLLPAKRSKNTYLPSDPKLLYEQKESVLAKELKAKKTVKSLIKGRNMLPEFYQQKLNKLFSEKNKTKLMVPNLKEH